mgnify:CR=1 FL=1
MAVKKTLTSAIPHSEDGKVVRWELEMEYEQGTEGEADYYASTRRTVVPASVTNDKLNAKGEVEKVTTTNFTPKAEGDWTKKELEDLCPIAQWDEIFASQYDSVITNPPKEAVANREFAIPS